MGHNVTLGQCVSPTVGELNKIKPIADEKNATLAQLVIRWTIDQPGITIVLVGARNPKQAEENAKAAEINLSKDEMNFINTELNKLELVKLK